MTLLLRLSAIVFLLVSATRSQGALHYTDFQNLAIPSNQDGIYVNPISGDFSLVPPADFNTAPWLNLLFGGTAIGSNFHIAPVLTAPATGNGDGLILKLIQLQEIGPGLNYAAGFNGSENHTGSGSGQFQPGEPGYLGFAIRTVADGPVSYGWMRITVSDNGSGIVHDAGYEDAPGVPILAGSVPEPGTSILIFAAAAVLIFSRRR